MPYIPNDQRRVLNDDIDKLAENIEAPGQLTYTIYRLMKHFQKRFGTRYSTFASIIGILETAKHEYYAQEIGPYEQMKLNENGGVVIDDRRSREGRNDQRNETESAAELGFGALREAN